MLVKIRYSKNSKNILLDKYCKKHYKIEHGLYFTHSFNSHLEIDDDWKASNELCQIGLSLYGVCDNVKQFKNTDTYKWIAADIDNHYIVVFTPIFKCDQGEYGWRWHKWGPYIGTQNPQYEYLKHEPDIDMVFVYSVYRLMK